MGRYRSDCDSELLALVAPLLGATLLHPRRAVKDRALALWNATFAQAQPLQYPDELRWVTCAGRVRYDAVTAV